jgi:hypothetical protein
VLCHGSNDKTGQDDLPLLRRDQVLIGFLRPWDRSTPSTKSLASA